jgi:hypothetical protein
VQLNLGQAFNGSRREIEGRQMSFVEGMAYGGPLLVALVVMVPTGVVGGWCTSAKRTKNRAFQPLPTYQMQPTATKITAL